MKTTTVLLPFVLAAVISCSSTEDSKKHESIRINQVAFYPSQEKTLTLEQTNDSQKIEIYRYGTGEKVDRYDMVMSIDDVKNTDMSTLPTSFGTGLFEVYAVSDKHLVLQRGALGTNGKREFQRASFWRDNDVIGFQYGDIYYEETNGKPTVSTTVGGVYGVTDVGTDYASRVYIIESPGLALLVVYNIE
jgi:hypothetical protein